ncbi:MAG: DEAD/DEAH box helicase family protein [Veillonellaceae bacterium]|nr:DEAD/DEAH box helicase family protein [Veillonellaceae bacterium]
MSDKNTVIENGLIWLPKEHFAVQQIRSALTFEYGSSTYNALKTFYLFRDRKDHIGVPRHFLSRSSLKATIAKLGLGYKDLRPAFPDGYERLDIESVVELDKLDPSLTVQSDAVKSLIQDDGILSLACGIGKTPVALHIWAQHRVPLVVLADNTSILEQWEKMIRLFIRPLDIKIGHVYDGRSEWDCPVVLASVQSLFPIAADFPMELRRRFGMVIIDEIHKVAAPVYNRVAGVFMGRRLGLTATPERSDRLEAVYQYHFGPVRFKYLKQSLQPRFFFYTPVSSKDLMEDAAFRKSISVWGELNVQKVWSVLAANTARTLEISNLIKMLVAEGRRVLVISQRKDLLKQLNERIVDAGMIIGSTPLATRTKVLAEAPVVLGIMGIAKEGLDSATLDTLVVCEPFKDKNLFQQVVGRILRDRPGKQAPKVILIQDALGNGAGPVYGLVRALKRVIDTWPADMGGPYNWTPFEV